MYQIRTMNQISDTIHEHLDTGHFIVGDDLERCDGMIVRSAPLHETDLPDSLLAIARAGIGVNNIPVERCNERGIAVFNTPGANANAVKELVLCALMLSGRRVLEGIEWLRDEKKAGTMDLGMAAEGAKNAFAGPELMGRTLGVIGLGAIGAMVARAASLGLGMKVLGYDPFLARHIDASVRRVKTLERLLEDSDYVTLHLPLTDGTRGMISFDQMSRMKTGVIVLNFARGALVNNKAMIEALETGRVASYVTDFPDDEITGVNGVVALPHLGACTPEAEDNCAAMAASQLGDYLLHGIIRNSVNLPECVFEKSPKPCITVLGSAGSVDPGLITEIAASQGCGPGNLIQASRDDWIYAVLECKSAPSQECMERLRLVQGISRIRVIT